MPKQAPNVILKIITCLIFAYQARSQNLPRPVAGDSLTSAFTIVKTWEMPAALREISGISYIDQERVACIQDEAGIIFIFNMSTAAVEAEIPFGPPGDYEAIAVVGNDAYVSMADGRIIEVLEYRSGRPIVKEYGTHLTVRQNVEGLCYDRKNKRLLVAIKGREEGSDNFKGIYAFDLAAKQMAVKPVFKLDLTDPIFRRGTAKRTHTAFQPSEIQIHPLNGDIYITDAIRAQVLILDSEGAIKMLNQLDRLTIAKPEGIMFTPSGDLYIASEGGRDRPGIICQLSVIK